MAIYSLNHKSIGKSTQERPYTAAAHVDYITRKRAMSRLDGARMPVDKAGAMDWFRREEDRARKNARMADKLMLALPRELSPDQRAALVRAFAESITKGRASWLAAFHDKGKDARNPHCHLVIRDRDVETGKRVAMLSENGSTERLRALWEVHANRALEPAGRDVRIDRRSLKAQGIEREPTIHVGVGARQVLSRQRKPVSRTRTVRNSCLARSKTREVDYGRLDGRASRLERNLEIVRKNVRRSRVAGREKEFWEALDRDSFERDMDMLKRSHGILPEREYGRRGPERDRDL